MNIQALEKQLLNGKVIDLSSKKMKVYYTNNLQLKG